LKGAEVKDAASERDKRQVIWSRAELEQEVCGLLGGTNPDLGRFSDLKPDDASRLLDYFLHPTGLLVDPAEDRLQFAHLSFQEYLCAEYIHGRAKSRGSRRFLDAIRELLYTNLGLPGWDEVGLLLLCIHAAEGAQTDPNAHLELLAELDPADLPQATLLVAALTGEELDFAECERMRWLPVVIAAALVQPEADLAARFGSVPAWAQSGPVLLYKLFECEDPFGLLGSTLAEASTGSFMELQSQLDDSLSSSGARWRNPIDDAGWIVDAYETEAQAYSLLALANATEWLWSEGNFRTAFASEKPGAQSLVSDWLRNQAETNGIHAYCRRWQASLDAQLPVLTCVGYELEAAMPTGIELIQWTCRATPLDAWVLHGESIGDSASVGSRPSMNLGLNSPESTRSRLGVGLYQTIIVAEALAGGDDFGLFTLLRLACWLFASMPSEHQPSISVHRSWDRLRYLLREARRSRQRSNSLLPAIYTSIHRDLGSLSAHYLPKISDATLCELKEACRTRTSDWKMFLARKVEAYALRIAALDWFNEQAEDPDLMRRRGLRPGQPLPPEFGLFDDTGRPNPQMPRAGVVRLREWVDDDDAVLGWFFPEGLSAEDDKDLREQLHILHHYERPDGERGQPWSPKAALDAVLADWPEDEPFREVTLEAAERDMIAALDALLPPEE
jgi:hypothetical protein